MASRKSFCIGSALFGDCARVRAHVRVWGFFFYCFLYDGKLRSLSLQRTAVVIEGGEFVLSGVLQSRNTRVATQIHTPQRRASL